MTNIEIAQHIYDQELTSDYNEDPFWRNAVIETLTALMEYCTKVKGYVSPENLYDTYVDIMKNNDNVITFLYKTVGDKCPDLPTLSGNTGESVSAIVFSVLQKAIKEPKLKELFA
jgi:hypothetical protein